MRPIVLLLACGLLVACGKNEAETYREKGNALCREVAEKARDIPEPRDVDEIVDYFEQITDIAFEANDDFAALDPPEDLENLHNRAVRESERAESEFRRLIARMRKAEDQARAARDLLRGLIDSAREGERLNRRLGLDDCNDVGLPGGSEPAPS